MSKSTIKGDSCENENILDLGGEVTIFSISGGEIVGADGGTIFSTGCGDIVGAGGVTIFSTGCGEITGAGGVGIRGNGVSTGSVVIGIAVSSAAVGIGDWCWLIDLISWTSKDLYGLKLDGYGSTLSLITSSTDQKKKKKKCFLEWNWNKNLPKK